LAPTDIRAVVLVWRSRMKMSPVPFVSPDTRFVADDWNVMYRPSSLMDGSRLAAFAWAPLVATETRVVDPAWRSRTNTSETEFVSRVTRLVAEEVKTAKRPSPLSELH